MASLSLAHTSSKSSAFPFAAPRHRIPSSRSARPPLDANEPPCLAADAAASPPLRAPSSPRAPAVRAKLPALNIRSRRGTADTFAPLTAADKFTHKWPRPRALRATAARAARGLWTERELRGALVEGKGLGVDGWGAWTVHKWWLFCSVVAVFAVAVVAVAVSVSTWFAGVYRCAIVETDEC
jgi:hypothetical protein